MDVFNHSYFTTAYKNYHQQNPLSKRLFYRSLVPHDILNNCPKPSVLDFGCAYGDFLSVLPQEWKRYGFDVNRDSIEHAQNMYPDIKFFTNDTIQGCPQSLDVITAFDVLEHVPDLKSTRDTIGSFLKGAGAFIFVVPVYDGFLGPVIRLLDKDETHVHKKSRAFWLRWTERFFTIDHWFGVFRYLVPGGYYIHRPTKVLRFIAPAIGVVARKK